MTADLYPPATREIAHMRRGLAPQTQATFDAFSRQVFADGVLSAKMKQGVAAEMRAGAAYAHSTLAIATFEEEQSGPSGT